MITSAATSSKVRMNSVPMILRLRFGIDDAGELGEELLRRVDGDEPDAGGSHVVALHLLALALAQQAVVDEHARELVADRAVHQRGGDRGVDATREAAEHVMVADARRGSRLIASSMMLAVVHVGAMPAPACRNRSSMVWPCAVCSTSGCHCTPKRCRSGCSNAAISAPSVRPVTAKPDGATTTASRCDIHTGCRTGWPANSTASESIVAVVRPNSAPSVRFTVPPSASAIAWKP